MPENCEPVPWELPLALMVLKSAAVETSISKLRALLEKFQLNNTGVSGIFLAPCAGETKVGTPMAGGGMVLK
jgi:hypothetical protein